MPKVEFAYPQRISDQARLPPRGLEDLQNLGNGHVWGQCGVLGVAQAAHLADILQRCSRGPLGVGQSVGGPLPLPLWYDTGAKIVLCGLPDLPVSVPTLAMPSTLFRAPAPPCLLPVPRAFARMLIGDRGIG